MASARAAKAREGTAGALKRAAFCDEGRKEQDDEDDVLLRQNGHQLSIVNAQRSANPWRHPTRRPVEHPRTRTLNIGGIAATPPAAFADAMRRWQAARSSVMASMVRRAHDMRQGWEAITDTRDIWHGPHSGRVVTQRGHLELDDQQHGRPITVCR